MTEFHRMAAMTSFIGRGASESDAVVAAIALHPFDGSRVPSRGYEKTVRKMSRQFARRNRKSSPTALASDARTTVKSYAQMASERDESYFADYFSKIVQPPATTSELG